MKTKITKLELLYILDILNENEAFDGLREIYNDLVFSNPNKIMLKYWTKKIMYKIIKMELLNFRKNIDRYII